MSDSYFIVRDNLKYVFYKAAMDDEITIEEFKKFMEIQKRAALPPFCHVELRWEEQH